MADNLKQFADEIKRHFDVTAESLRTEIRQVAEGVINLDERMGREIAEFRTEVRGEFAGLRERIEPLERNPS